ncbi:MAG: M23 family metallopeptidase [Verrucomicrobiae bacterium]|nr:M23 family metallopeptidase [Verrucomicrobiae bacterium]
MTAWRRLACGWLAVAALTAAAGAQPFQFPTANRTLLQPGREADFFQGTAGRPWTSGQYGCVRSEGNQFHEGVDIRAIQRDRAGEPVDPVLASAPGAVAYVNARSPLSNYGIYIVLRHRIEGMEVYTLYAHLREVREGLKVGTVVQAGERIATLGRTSNTNPGISKDRAHLHFEICLVVNDRYAAWHRERLTDQRNDHANFNGRNLMGVDPAAVFLQQARMGREFRFVDFLRGQPVLARVAVRSTHFPWLRRYPQLVVPNSVAEREGIAGYELGLAFTGLPVRLKPLAASEMPWRDRVRLVEVSAVESSRHPCSRLAIRRGTLWTLLPRGQDIVDLITYQPSP